TVGINESGGDFSIIHQAHGSMTHRTSGGETDASGKAAVGFDEGEQALAALRKLQRQKLGSIHAHPHSQHLAWTEMLVQSSRLCQQKFQSGIHARLHHVALTPAAPCGLST